jgi:PhzF family phenazine biosynthesis protein
MELQIFQVDAFASELFRGNPAAVMPLDHWLDDAQLQSIAMENNLSETAFLVAEGDGFSLRWFTPEVEVDLCGHATLAAAHVLYEHLGHAGDDILFSSKSGELRVSRGANGITLDFPALEMIASEVNVSLCDALGAVASETFATADASGPLLYVYEFEEDVSAMTPDFSALRSSGVSAVIATAPGNECDFVSRFFAPLVGIDEDPVTGSAHCSLVPYWSGRLQKDALDCRQISARGGSLQCELRGDRVFMSGRAVTFMRGTVLMP